MLHSGSWPLLRNILSSSIEAFSCEISGITWVESDNVFLVLLRMNEPRFDRRTSFWANEILLSSSLIEYLIYKGKLFYSCQSFWLFSCLIAGSNDFFVIIYVIEIKIVKNVIWKIHVY